MRVKVSEQFLDKFTRNPHMVGEVLNLEDPDRVQDLVSRGLVQLLDVPVKEKKGAKNARKSKACPSDIA